MGELARQFQAERIPNGGSREPVLTTILRDMSDEDRADLLDALADPTISSGAIHRVLASRGHKLGITSIKAYRRGEVTNVFQG